jgi:hypothetical protein
MVGPSEHVTSNAQSINDVVATLRGISALVDYGWDQPLNDVDSRLDNLLEITSRLDMDGLASIANKLGPNEIGVLGIYSRRVAQRAIGDVSESDIRAGLNAVILARWDRKVDPRDVMVGLAPLHVAASRVAGSATRIFDSAAEQAPASLADVLRVFGRRNDVTLETFGWKEVDTPNGRWITSRS